MKFPVVQFLLLVASSICLSCANPIETDDWILSTAEESTPAYHENISDYAELTENWKLEEGSTSETSEHVDDLFLAAETTDGAPTDPETASFTTDGWFLLTEEESTPASQENATDYEEPTENWKLEDESTSEAPENVLLRKGQLLNAERSLPSMEDVHEYEIEPRLRIERSPYSAQLYLEDEFGLEFLCAGYWLREDVLLIRADCWPENVGISHNGVDQSVAAVFANEKLHLRILLLWDDADDDSISDSPEHSPPHFVNIRDESPSLEHCALYVLLEDDALFEKWTWSAKPLPFKRANGPCDDGQFCLRVRPSSPNGRDYALICEQSLVGMLAGERTKYERVFGKLSLLDVSQAKPWVEKVLEYLDEGLNDEEIQGDGHKDQGEEEDAKEDDGKKDQDAIPYFLSLIKLIF